MSGVLPPYPLYGVVASAVELVTPRLKRITVDASKIPGLCVDRPSQWVKVFISEQGDRRPGRAYTVRRFDPECLHIDLDFVLHGDDGIVSTWAGAAEVGDRFEISAPHARSGIEILPGPGNYLLVADETGLPAVASILEALNSSCSASVLLEVADRHEEQLLTTKAKVDLRWIHRDNATPCALTKSVASMDLSAFDEVWVTAESAQVTGIRADLKARGIWGKAKVHTSGYWKSGVSDHRDAD